MSSTTLQVARWRCAHELGPFDKGTASADSTKNALVDNTWPVLSGDNYADLFKGRFLFRPNAALESDKVRIVSDYVPTSGTLIVDATYTNAPVAGEAYELHAIIEPYTRLTALINQAIKRTFLVAEFSLQSITNQARHSLATAAPWLDNVEWVRQVGFLGPSEDRDLIDPYIYHPMRGRCHTDGNAFWLDHFGYVFNGLEVIYVRALKPAYFHCSSDGVTIDRTSGVSADTDVIFVPEDWIAAGVLVEAWRDYAHVLTASDNQDLLKDRAEAAQWFTRLSEIYLSKPRLTFTPMEAWGPGIGSWGPIL